MKQRLHYVGLWVVLGVVCTAVFFGAPRFGYVLTGTDAIHPRHQVRLAYGGTAKGEGGARVARYVAGEERMEVAYARRGQVARVWLNQLAVQVDGAGKAELAYAYAGEGGGLLITGDSYEIARVVGAVLARDGWRHAVRKLAPTYLVLLAGVALWGASRRRNPAVRYAKWEGHIYAALAVVCVVYALMRAARLPVAGLRVVA